MWSTWVLSFGELFILSLGLHWLGVATGSTVRWPSATPCACWVVTFRLCIRLITFQHFDSFDRGSALRCVLQSAPQTSTWVERVERVENVIFNDTFWYIFWTDKCCRFFWSKFSDGLQGSSWLQASGTWRTCCFLTQAWRRLKLSEKSKNAIYDFMNLWHCIAKTWRQTLFNVAKAHCSQTSSFRVNMCKFWKNMEMRKAYKSNDKQQIVRGLRHRETFDVSSTCSCNPKTARSRRMSLAKIQYGCAETNWAFRSFKLSSEPWSFREPVFGKLSTFLGRS